MKTPMQELIDSVGYMAQGLDADELYDYFMEKATQMLEKEKETICNAFSDAQHGAVESRWTAEEYFEETFNTKEK
jgi:hypothetical protein